MNRCACARLKEGGQKKACSEDTNRTGPGR